MNWGADPNQEKRILNVIKDSPDENKAFDAWESYLKEKLRFPFEAIVIDSDYGGTIEEGDKLKVHNISMIDSLHGIIVDVRKGRRKYAFALCLLEAVDKDLNEPIDDYGVWFFNR
jgi:hypothetical protein